MAKKIDRRLIRNFSIVAHIDHGKSTLADRIIEETGGLTKREMQAQVLDSLDIERERGITIKAQTVRLEYKAQDGEVYYFNLIDTPGHVDFTYEVSRSLAACEGALVIVDAAQGVEAQTLANVYLAMDANLEMIPVINKIDLPSADIDEAKKQIEELIGLDSDGAIPVSAKLGTGIGELLEDIVRNIPAPPDHSEKPLRALIMDSWYDNYLGVVLLVRVVEGCIKKGQRIQMHHMNSELEEVDRKFHAITKIGYFTPKPFEIPEAHAGDVVFVVCSIKSVRETRIGDTITHWPYQDADQQLPVATEALPGFKPVKNVVFSGIFPVDSRDLNNLREALEKLSLNDSSITFEKESSAALGLGFRCGYLGLLHMEIVQERLEREYQLSLITTAPSVTYWVHTKKLGKQSIENPSKLPPLGDIEKIEEPYIRGSIHTPSEYIGSIITLCESRRGEQEKIDFLSTDRCNVIYCMPLSEMVFDFYDKLKSCTKGYASFDYEIIAYRESKLVKLDVLINGEAVDALSLIVHKDKAYSRGAELVKKMREVIDRQQFQVAIQAAIGTKIIARETVSALRKNVTAKCYGGDISRKRKLLEKQKEGKKRMKQIGSVEISQDAFLAVLKID